MTAAALAAASVQTMFRGFADVARKAAERKV